MLIVGIIQYSELLEDPNAVLDLQLAYIGSFTSQPWYERDWSIEKVDEVFSNASFQEGFLGYGVEIQDRIIGGCLGYTLPQENAPTINFIQLRKRLPRNLEGSFYLAESFILPQFQRRGLGSVLMNMVSNSIENSSLLFRTINDNQIKAIQRGFNSSVEEICRDPVDEERIWLSIGGNKK